MAPFLILGRDGTAVPPPDGDFTGTRPLNALGLRMLGDLPPFLRDDPLTQAVIHAYSQEAQRISDQLDELILQWFPQTATELGLPLWEARTAVTVSPPGLTLDQRRAVVLAALARLRMAPSVIEYQALLDRIIGPGYTYAENNPLDPSSVPPPNTVLITLPFSAGSDVFRAASRLIGIFTPVWIDLEISSAEGFTLDVSELDTDALG